MSGSGKHAYRFATPAQWGSGILARGSIGEDGAAGPYSPHAPGAESFPAAGGAWAPACAHDGSAWWRDAHGRLYLLAPGAAAPVSPVAVDAGWDIARAARLVVGRRMAWAATPGDCSVSCYARDDFGHVRSAGIAGSVIDIAGAGRDGVWVLAARDGAHWLLHIDARGRQRAGRRLPAELRAPQALACLRASGAIVLLAEQGERLWVLGLDASASRPPLAVGSLRTGFRATRLGSDGHRLLVLGGRDDDAAGGQWAALVADVHGDVLDEVAGTAPLTGVSLHRELLLITTTRDAQCHRAGAGDAAKIAAPASLEFMTPPLHAPDANRAQGWLRAELSARLPRGALLSVEWAGSDRDAVRDEALRIARDHHLPPQVRQAQLARLLGPWSAPLLFAGDGDGTDPQPLEAPLFQVGAPHLWLRIRLSAPSGSLLPRLVGLRALYAEQSLMEQLPAIFRRDDDPQDFLRALVGVLETTTQGLDRKIGSIGSLLHPELADAGWLDYTARWLGLPWDDALDLERKRRLLRAGHRILALRGTRAGLELLLASLFPELPQAWQIRDFSADSLPLRLGGKGRAGAALPALLAGLPRTAPALGRRLILGRARLPGAYTAPGPAMPWVGLARIDMFASPQVPADAERWLPALVDAVVPLTARVALRWRRHRPCALVGDSATLGATGRTRLGGDAILGDTRLGAQRPMTLSESGEDLGFRLE